MSEAGDSRAELVLQERCLIRITETDGGNGYNILNVFNTTEQHG